jgi:hypothetical protein
MLWLLQLCCYSSNSEYCAIRAVCSLCHVCRHTRALHLQLLLCFSESTVCIRAAAAAAASIVYAASEVSLPIQQSERHAAAAVYSATVHSRAHGSVVAFTLKQYIGSIFCVVRGFDRSQGAVAVAGSSSCVHVCQEVFPVLYCVCALHVCDTMSSSSSR